LAETSVRARKSPRRTGRSDIGFAKHFKDQKTKTGHTLADVTFRTRVRDESVGGPSPFRWQDMTTDDYFKGSA